MCVGEEGGGGGGAVIKSKVGEQKKSYSCCWGWEGGKGSLFSLKYLNRKQIRTAVHNPRQTCIVHEKGIATEPPLRSVVLKAPNVAVSTPWLV